MIYLFTLWGNLFTLTQNITFQIREYNFSRVIYKELINKICLDHAFNCCTLVERTTLKSMM